MPRVYNLLADFLKQKLPFQNEYFVFQTELSAQQWADWATDSKNSGTSAVALERFLAWDSFKSNAIKSQNQDKKTIPSVLRKLFAEDLVLQNSKEAFLQEIIPPQYAKDAQAFAPWIARILPSLALWQRRSKKVNLEQDAEDKDLLEIYTRYKSFLDAHNLFDPAWEIPPFVSDGKKYNIIFPEILEDYDEYKELLESAKDIFLLPLPKINCETLADVNFYANSRTEIRKATDLIQELHFKDKIPWQQIALTIPNPEDYAAYVERDLELKRIPFSFRSGKNLSQTGAGSFFKQILDCFINDFSFESIKTLLMNDQIPWLDPESSLQLIKFGQDNNCLCSFVEDGIKKDVWLEAFEQAPQESRALAFYKKLKSHIQSFAGAKSFEQLKKQYFNFRNSFLDMTKCSPYSDKILSRCITELGALIDIESQYPDCTAASPAQFFTDYIDGIMYLQQASNTGIQIFPYRVAAQAPFAAHIVLDSSQASLTVSFRQLSFLREDKRKKLGLIEETNVSEQFIQLYAESSAVKTYFCAAQKTFSAYAISHNALNERDYTKSAPDEDSSLIQLSEIHKMGFSYWKAAQDEMKDSVVQLSEKELLPLVQKVCTKTTDNGVDKIRISASALRTFYECPRKFLFSRVLNVQEQVNEAELMDPFAMGNIYHAVLENYCKALIKESLLLQVQEDGHLPAKHQELLNQSIDFVIQNYDGSILARKLLDTSKAALSKAATQIVEAFSDEYAGYEVIQSEKKLEFYPEDKDYFFTGRIDCLLRNNDESEYVLVDFKSSKKQIHDDSFFYSKGGPVPDFQMPSYLYLYKNASKKDEQKNVSNCVFYELKSKKSYPVAGTLVCDKGIEELNDTISHFVELSENYASRIKNLDFSLDLKNFNEEQCYDCAYKAVCRKIFNISKKND